MQKRELEIQPSPFSTKQAKADSKSNRADLAKEVLIEGNKSPRTKPSLKIGEAELPDGL